jgi:hypothetical protein
VSKPTIVAKIAVERGEKQLQQKEQALLDIHKFYARQHFKQNIMFEQQAKLEVLKHADLNCFCKDFDIPISNKTQLEIYKKVSPQQKPFDLDMFKSALPLLGLEMAKNKALEVKYRLKELKGVLEYPDA